MMEVIEINQEHKDFVAKYAPGQDIGGFSNLSVTDLKKSSRLGFQYTGIYGELAWYLYRYGNYEKLRRLLEHKFETLRPAHQGDGGFDDQITHNGFTRLIDIKTTHIVDEEQIFKLNLVIPEREYHINMIYICAFTIGENKSDRLNVDRVILAGWCANEGVVNRWHIDPNKYAVTVNHLRNLSALKKIL
jgi:hypothetical protein